MMTIDKLCFLGFCVNKDYFDSFSRCDQNPQIAAYKFESRLINGLRENGVHVDVIASQASSTYPKNKHIFFPAQHIIKPEGTLRTLFSINLPGLKLLNRFLLAAYQLGKWARKNKKQSAVCIYSAHSPYLFAAYLISIIFKTPYFVIIPDLPCFMSFGNRNIIVRYLKKVDEKIIDWLVKKSTGISVITEAMVLDKPVWQRTPYIVIEGICEGEEQPTIDASPEVKNNCLLYAGGLNIQYGVKMLIDSFVNSDLDLELWLCGRGDLEGYVHEVTLRDKRVKYFGYLDSQTLKNIQNQSKGLIISRDPALLYTRYSFPSKILEYMLSGIPTLSTRLAGIPKEYFEFLIPIEGYDEESIVKSIKELQNNENVYANAIKGRRYVLENKNMRYMTSKFLRFINETLA